MSVRFAPAEPRDVEALLGMMRELQADDPWEEPFNESALRMNLEKLLCEPVYGQAFVAWDGAEPAG